MWQPNIKAINITKLVQFFSTLDLDIFSMSAASCIVYYWLISNNVLIWLLLTSTGLSHHEASSSEKSPAQNWSNHFWHIRSVTAPSSHTAHIFFFFLVSVVIFTFLEIIKHNMLKCYFFPAPFNIKMATQKFINFDKFLKNACWYYSCHNTIQQNFFQWS